MKYTKLVNKGFMGSPDSVHICIKRNDESFISFPAEIGNPNYDQFLIQVDLTDEEVHALPVDEWINFSEGSVE